MLAARHDDDDESKKLATVVEGDPKSPFSIAITLRCKGGLIDRAIDLMRRVFVNGPGDRGSIPGQVIPKTQKMVLDAALLNT